jgi:hypothetical protein
MKKVEYFTEPEKEKYIKSKDVKNYTMNEVISLEFDVMTLKVDLKYALNRIKLLEESLAYTEK